MEKKYRLRYLEIALLDLQDIVIYISDQLSAPVAASDFVDKLDRSISNLELFPFSGHIFRNNYKLDDEYRMLVVENYIVFYVVYRDVVEIRRIMYGKRNYDELTY